MQRYPHLRVNIANRGLIAQPAAGRSAIQLKDNRPQSVIQQKRVNAMMIILPKVNNEALINQPHTVPQSTMPLQFVKHKRKTKRHEVADEPIAKEPIISKGGKRTMLLGTQHGVQGKDVSGEVPADMRNNAAIVLEYPTLHGTGHTAFSADTIKTVNDKTQTILAHNARENEEGSNLETIGADGRKAFEGEKIHSISLRHKEEGIHYGINPVSVIPNSLLFSLMDKYVDRCLHLSNGNAIPIAQRLNGIIQYIDGTNLEHVMVSTYSRMREIVIKLPVSQRKSIADKVMSRLSQDMDKVISYYRANKVAYKKNDYLNALVSETNNDLISVTYDAMANLLLYTEVLASSKPKIIVAFGAEHLPPLQQLLGETWAKRRKYKK